MPRYFFNVYDDMISQDEEGVELPNLAAAHLQALAGARDIISTQVKHGYFARSHWIDVIDENGDAVLTLSFGEAVEVRG